MEPAAIRMVVRPADMIGDLLMARKRQLESLYP